MSERYFRDTWEWSAPNWGPLEVTGALNFLDLDDLPVLEEGELVDPRSIVSVHTTRGRPVMPDFQRVASDPFLKRLDASGQKW
jgi:hypothetical protein